MILIASHRRRDLPMFLGGLVISTLSRGVQSRLVSADAAMRAQIAQDMAEMRQRLDAATRNLQERLYCLAGDRLTFPENQPSGTTSTLRASTQ
jgi:ABC-type Zn2+ transport system substrate-binding protein/surface adhesin